MEIYYDYVQERHTINQPLAGGQEMKIKSAQGRNDILWPFILLARKCAIVYRPPHDEHVSDLHYYYMYYE